MAISKAQFKAANVRGAAVIARGPIAQAVDTIPAAGWS